MVGVVVEAVVVGGCWVTGVVLVVEGSFGI